MLVQSNLLEIGTSLNLGAVDLGNLRNSFFHPLLNLGGKTES